eukprot:791222-Rhodomonas_salina.4
MEFLLMGALRVSKPGGEVEVEPVVKASEDTINAGHGTKEMVGWYNSEHELLGMLPSERWGPGQGKSSSRIPFPSFLLHPTLHNPNPTFLLAAWCVRSGILLAARAVAYSSDDAPSLPFFCFHVSASPVLDFALYSF